MRVQEDLPNLWVAEGARRLALAYLDDGPGGAARLPGLVSREVSEEEDYGSVRLAR